VYHVVWLLYDILTHSLLLSIPPYNTIVLQLHTRNPVILHIPSKDGCGVKTSFISRRNLWGRIRTTCRLCRSAWTGILRRRSIRVVLDTKIKKRVEGSLSHGTKTLSLLKISPLRGSGSFAHIKDTNKGEDSEDKVFAEK
jgi:hypothetical protein